MAVTLRLPTTLPTTPNGTSQIVDLDPYGQHYGFRDVTAGSNKQIVVAGRVGTSGTGYVYLFTSLNGTTWSYVLLCATDYYTTRLKCMTQSSDGAVHIVLHSVSTGAITYKRFTLTHSGGNIASATEVASFSAQHGTATLTLFYDLTEVTAQNGSKHIVLCQGVSDGSTDWYVYASKFPVDATTVSQRVGLDGTGSSTTIHYGLENGHVRAPFVCQNKSDLSLVFTGGYILGEFPTSSDYIAKAHATTNGATTWTVTSAWANTSIAGCVIGRSYAAGDFVYFSCIGVEGTPRYRIHKIAANGTITQNAFPAVTVDAYSGWSMVSISNDETIAYMACETYYDQFTIGSCTGGTWTTNNSGAMSTYGIAGAAWPRGLAIVSAEYNATDKVATVWDDVVDPDPAPLSGVSAGTSEVTGNLTTASPAALSGAITGTSTTAAALTVGVTMSGATSGSSVGAGTIAGRSSLSTATSGVSAVSGAVLGAASLSGSTSGTSTTIGALAGMASTSGATSGTAAATGAILGTASLAANTNGAPTVTGAILGAAAMVAVAIGTSTATGNLSLSSAASFSGSSAGASTAQGSLSGVSAVSGAASGTSVASGSASGAVSVTGAASGSSTATASLTALAQNQLAGASYGSSMAFGALSGAVSLSGASASSSASTAYLASSVGMSGQSDGAALVIGSLVVLSTLSVTVTGSSTVIGALLGTSRFVGASSGASTVTGAVTISGAGVITGGTVSLTRSTAIYVTIAPSSVGTLTITRAVT